MTGRQRFQVPEGWVARGWRFEVEPTRPQQRSAIARHFGARRFAYNWALAQVKANLDARTADPTVPALAWNLPAIRRDWNQAKHQVAPWWRECSKEAYACGIADLVAALHNWADAKHGRRGGRRVGFPRFKARHRDRGRVRFTTGAMRLEPDRRHIVVPVIGRLRSKENTRRLERVVAKDRARILSMTLTEQGRDGRLYVSVATIVAQTPRIPSQPGGRCGIDLGIGQEWAVIAHADDTIQPIAHPAPWAAVQHQRRRVARQRSRRVVGSRGYRQANAKLGALDRRAANLRRESIHTLTTNLARRYGTVVVEDLDIAAMARGMGRRAFRRSVYQAGLGRVRPTLAYKCAWAGGRLVVADRWFASSKTHHGCGGYCPDLQLGERVWVCPTCEGLVDRNANAARNLRDWTGPVADRDVQRGGVAAPVPCVGDHGGQAHASAWACEAPEDHRQVAGADDTRTKPHGARNPEQGYQALEHPHAHRPGNGLVRRLLIIILLLFGPPPAPRYRAQLPSLRSVHRRRDRRVEHDTLGRRIRCSTCPAAGGASDPAPTPTSTGPGHENFLDKSTFKDLNLAGAGKNGSYRRPPAPVRRFQLGWPVAPPAADELGG